MREKSTNFLSDIMGDGGKGSKPRPFSVSHDEWSNRWDAIFGRDLKKDELSQVLPQDNLASTESNSSDDSGSDSQ